MAETQEFESVLATIRHWPEPQQISLAKTILQAHDPMATCGPPRRGKPVERLIGLGAGDVPPPSDATVSQWIDEHRIGKYSS
jgi:hypothetical protein